MLERMTYLEEQDGICICRCYGSGAYIDMPSFVRGKPVTALKDHCFAPSPSIRIDQSKLKSILRSEWQQENRQGWDGSSAAPSGENKAAVLLPEDTDNPMCALALREIDLPRTLKRTEGYVFYGCRNLRRLRFPASFETLGGGNFVDCNHLQYLEFAFEPEKWNPALFRTPDCMKDVVVDINYEIEARILEGDSIFCQLLFPGYIEDSEENTPARLIAVKYEGMGYKYRQCFKDRKLDFDAYDSLFYFTSIQELPPTILLCALNRLRYPALLSKKAETAYLDYLKSCPEKVFQKILKEEDIETLQMLQNRLYFDRERLELCLQMASAKGNAQIVSLLMEYRREHFAGRKKRYSFDD